MSCSPLSLDPEKELPRGWPIIGALASGERGRSRSSAGGRLGIGSHAVTASGQIELHPETLRFRTAVPLQQPTTRRMGFRLSFPPAPVPCSCLWPPLKRRLDSEGISDMAFSRNSKPPQKSFLRRLVGGMCFASLSGSEKQFLGPLLLIQRRRKARSHKRLP